MKKGILLSISVLLIMALLAGCSSGVGNILGEVVNQAQQATQNQQATEAENAAEQPTEEPAVSDESASAVVENAVEETEESLEENVEEEVASADKPSRSFESVIVDDDNMTIKATGTQWSDYYYQIKFYLENKTTHDLTFSFSNVALEGFMVGGSMYETVKSGLKMNSTMDIYTDDMDLVGLTDPTWIQFQANVYDEEYNSEGYPYGVYYSIYPMGEENATYFTYTLQEGQEELINESGVRVIRGEPYYESDYGEFGFVMVVENTNTFPVTVSVDDGAINGFVCDPWFYQGMGPQTLAIVELYWDEDDLQDIVSDPSELEEFQLSWNVYNTETYESFITSTSTFKMPQQ